MRLRSCGGELKSGRGAGVGAVADASVGGRARSTLAAASQQTGAGSGGYAAADEVVLSCFVPYRFSQVGLAQPNVDRPTAHAPTSEDVRPCNNLSPCRPSILHSEFI